MKDIDGRQYLLVSEAKAGMLVECDDDFTCVEPNKPLRLYDDDEGDLYFHCSEGCHYLNGQRRDNYYIGVYLVKA